MGTTTSSCEAPTQLTHCGNAGSWKVQQIGHTPGPGAAMLRRAPASVSLSSTIETERRPSGSDGKAQLQRVQAVEPVDDLGDLIDDVDAGPLRVLLGPLVLVNQGP